MLLCFFFLFLVIFNSFFIIPVVKENIKLKLAFAISTGTPITLVKEIIDIPPLVADKTIKVFDGKRSLVRNINTKDITNSITSYRAI